MSQGNPESPADLLNQWIEARHMALKGAAAELITAKTGLNERQVARLYRTLEGGGAKLIPCTMEQGQ